MYFIASDLKNIKHEVVELIVSLFFALSCLLLFWLLPTEIKGRSDMFEMLLRLILFLIIFPFLYIKIILKRSLVDMYLGKYQHVSQTILPIIFALAVGVLSTTLITQSFLGEHYISLVGYLSGSFKVFLIYEIFIAIFYLFFVIFSFGFVNLITENFNKLNRALPIITYYFLLLSFFDISFKILVINMLMILPTLFFRRIVNVSNNVWSLYFLLVILNIILNATIIKVLL